MKKFILAVAISFVTIISNAQKWMVYSLSGKVEDVSANTAKPLRLRDVISANTKLNIPYRGCVVLFDESSSQQLTLKNPGRATVKEMMSDKKNSIKKLTSDYLAFIKKQVTGGGQILVRNCSDPATVTRNLMVALDYGKDGSDLVICGVDGYTEARNTLKKEFNNFRKNMLDDYQKFRKNMLNDYADFVRDPWKTVQLIPAEEKPKDEKIRPLVVIEKGGKTIIPDFGNKDKLEKNKVTPSPLDGDLKPLPTVEEKVNPIAIDDKGKPIMPDFDLTNNDKPVVIPFALEEDLKPIVIEEEFHSLSIDDKSNPIAPDFDKNKTVKKQDLILTVLPVPQPLPIPELVVPVKENLDTKGQYHSFSFFGTEMKVRWTDDCKFTIKSMNENAIADAIAALSDPKYDNVLYDCLQLRDTYHLSDWAYYLMLKEVSAQLCGKDTNEATLLMAMLYSQSGYRIRLAKAGQKLLTLISTQFNLYGYSYMIMDGCNWYLLDGDYSGIDFCNAHFEKEREMSLIMRESPRFTNNNSEIRSFASPYYNQLVAQVSVNKNLMDFYATYPSAYFNNNFMTRWAMYANKEMQPEVREQLYPQLKDMIAGKSQREKVESLLNWIQTSFKYEYDDVVWGCDRAFFAEESLYYSGCDCEDRSILFTRLVRDLVGLKCILVFYPGHLASGVCFTENIDGDFVDVDGNRFTICDPTIIGRGAPIGWTMRGMDNSSASVIVLE